MIQEYGAKWSRENGDDPSEGWIRLLGQLQDSELRRVVAQIREKDEYSDWPPALRKVREEVYLAWLFINGLPSPEEAYALARRGKWSVDAVYDAACETGLGDLCGSAHLPAKQDDVMWPRFRKHYGQSIGKIRAGETLRSHKSSDRPALPKPDGTAPVTDVGYRHLDAMRSRLGLPPKDRTEKPVEAPEMGKIDVRADSLSAEELDSMANAVTEDVLEELGLPGFINAFVGAAQGNCPNVPMLEARINAARYLIPGVSDSEAMPAFEREYRRAVVKHMMKIKTGERVGPQGIADLRTTGGLAAALNRKPPGGAESDSKPPDDGGCMSGKSSEDRGSEAH